MKIKTLKNDILKSKVRTFSATDRNIQMLSAIADYHGFSKSAIINALIRKEFWRIFPEGTVAIPSFEQEEMHTKDINLNTSENKNS